MRFLEVVLALVQVCCYMAILAALVLLVATSPTGEERGDE